MDNLVLYLLPVVVFGLVAIGYAAWLAKGVLSMDQGTAAMQDISNRIFDLRPVLTRLASEHSLLAAWLGAVGAESEGDGRRESLWFALARRPEERASLSSLGWNSADNAAVSARRVWSDDYVNLFDGLR